MHTHQNTLPGRVALVTGAGSGIGKAAALYLAEAGAKIAALTLKQEDADATAQEIRRAGGEAIAIAGDVSHEASIREAVARVETAWGRLDVVVANAGINGVWAPLEELTPEDWDKTLNVNLKGTFLTVRAAARLLKAQGGAVVIVSSVNGTRIFSNTGATAYSCSKAGQVVFSRMVALEFARHKVRVNTVCPGAIETNIHQNTVQKDLETIRTPVEFPEGSIPLTDGESGQARQVAELIWFLASDLSAHITGTEVFIDGAQSLLQG